MNVLIPLAVVVGLFLVGMLGAVPGLGWVFGVVLTYVAIVVFLAGLVQRVLGWANCAVPFRIPTTCGQQKSLTWVKPQPLENPHSTLAVVGRMALEVLFFRSLLRNTSAQLVDGKRLVYTTNLWLWLGAMVMHWSLLIILARHLRLVIASVPGCITFLQAADGFLQVGLPVIYVSSAAFLVGLIYLLVRRLRSGPLHYISLISDYFPLFLLLGIGLSGFCLRHLAKTDIVGVKELAVGLVSLRPTVPGGIGWLFYGHLFLVCVLLIYFPFSKLVHMPGVFLSPTRNLANTNRSARHVNPWDYPVKVHPYAEYEDELRDKMKGAGLPVEKE